MSGFGPRSLRTQITLVLLVGLIASNLIGLLIYTGDRASVLLSVTGATDAARIASVVRTMDNLTPADRGRAVCTQSGPGLVIALTDTPVAVNGDLSRRARRLQSDLRGFLGTDAANAPRVAQYATGAHDPFAATLERCGTEQGGFMAQMMRRAGGMQGAPKMARMMQRFQAGNSLVLSWRLRDGRWLNIETPVTRVKPVWRSRFVLAFLLIAASVTVLSVWAVRRSTAPLALFAWAAERLGRDVNAPDLPEDGPTEVSKAAHAFNEMQRRLHDLITDRTRMLAAISHDMRTPITRLRLRAEFVDDAEQRTKMLDDLAQMEAMISSVLGFARLDSSDEQARALDLAGLLRSVCDNAAETGREARYEGPDRLTFIGRPVALRRVFENLVDNALNYGHRAVVRLASAPENRACVVIVDDDGPGIPSDALLRVFDPFQRLETSRSRETGGVGLGLAVVRSILRGHGGNITLENRPEGGLRARVTLPRTGPAAGDVK